MDIIIYPKTFKIRLAFTWGLLIMAWSTLAGGVARLSVNNDAVAADGEALQRPEKAIGVFSIKKTDHVNLQSQKRDRL
ncbi:hypothetical protein E05_30960 [Plautia stali symbiont]|nr:hypothetical protein E05_30960 [Plautia stali symbiont]